MASAALTNFRDNALSPPTVESTPARLMTAGQASTPEFLTQWQSLVACAAEPNPFFEPWYLIPSLENFAGAGKAQIFATFDGTRLTGVFPITSSNLYYKYPVPHLAGWTHDNMFCGAPLAAKGHEHAFWQALLDHIDQSAGKSLFFHLPALPADGPMARALSDVCGKQNRKAAVVHSHTRAMLQSEMNAEEYFGASLKNKRRKELRRQKRRLEEMGELTFSRETDATGSSQWTEEFLTLEKAGWKGDQGSALAEADATRNLFEAALSGAAQAGRLERLTLRLDNKPIAMLANFITQPGSYSFKTAFDEDYYRFSPGVLLQQENLSLLERDDVDWCDSCAAAGHPMIEHIWREKRRMISVSLAIGGPVRRAMFAGWLRAETHTPLHSEARENCS
ncbi:MAG: GNAT family N-acetyltransferase [Erythrobacter sp.]